MALGTNLGPACCGVMRETPLLNVRPSLPFVGRQVELARGAELLGALDREHAAVLLVIGEPGVGKTRFLDELFARAADHNVALARAACLPLGTPLPFEPVL